MGTPDFSVPCLETLVKTENVKAVFTQPDKPKGRGFKMIPTPVKESALKYDIPVYQPVSLRKGEDAENSLKLLREINPDLIVVTAYGQILPKEILDLPKYGCINIHASLLPAYRGAAPIQWCVLNGEEKTGVTSMQMGEGLDTGDMLIKKETKIGVNETSAELFERLAVMGGEVLQETLNAVKNNTLQPVKQDDSLSSYSPMITKNMSSLDFSKSAEEIHNIIRGITGFTMLNGKRLKIYHSSLTDDFNDAQNGEIVDVKNFGVKCGDGRIIKFEEVQLEGSKRMKVSDFLRGKKLEKGCILG
ncbi:MAG: methionyl-tRNA formyltransferase [Oscillospiraceae bacterium]|nr:methionyl-tRNA formyltransferase [Oscillospiraceae bacterium]